MFNLYVDNEIQDFIGALFCPTCEDEKVFTFQPKNSRF